MRFVIVDLEATCWRGGQKHRTSEIIEIGAVLFDGVSLDVVHEFSRFVRPVWEPVLSGFCIELTTIAQDDVDRAAGFGEVFAAFLDWIGPEPFVLCSWGAYDYHQLQLDCRRHGVAFPASFERYIDLKQFFAAVWEVEPCGMVRALELLGLPLDGTHHRGIDDARNIARVVRVIAPYLQARVAQLGWG